MCACADGGLAPAGIFLLFPVVTFLPEKVVLRFRILQGLLSNKNIRISTSKVCATQTGIKDPH